MERPAAPHPSPAGDAPASGRLLGRGYQGEVHLVQTEQGPVIVKRAIGRGPALALRRAMLRRERAVYGLLEGIPGVPRCLDPGARGDELVLEFIEGRSLRETRLAPAERERFFAQLLELIRVVHAAGVGHGDLKRKDNILVGPGGRPHLIDFGTAVAAPRGAGPLRRLALRQVQRMDLNAWFKLKYQRQRGVPAAADLALYRPTPVEDVARVLRRAWRALTLRRRRKARRAGRD